MPGTTEKVSFASAIAFVVSATLGCGPSGYGPEDNPTAVRDVTGVEFGWSCRASGCGIALLPATPAPDACGAGDTPTYGWAAGRFFEICSACAPQSGAFVYSTQPGQCRVLACDTSADCPIMFEDSPVDVYTCVNGLCQNSDQQRWPREPLQRMDAEELCFAVHPRADTNTLSAPATLQVEADLDASCTGSAFDDTCSLPTGCRAP
jgi:hypothetical protein